MANPTTNFGWVMPTSSSLVTNLPADFNTFGQAVDTSMSELLGGTTGQVLSKTSNTNMDFTWVTPTDQTPLTTKGDLFTFTTVDARLAVGANGETLVADSSTSTGLRWQASQVAGKNAIINGDFLINQRAFTSNTTSGTYNFDRWSQSNSGGTYTLTPQTFTPGAAPIATYEGRTYLQAITASQASDDYALIRQRIEDVTRYAGATVTVSFFAKANTGTPKIGVELYQNFGTGGSPSSSVSTPAGAITLSTSWARYSVTVAVPSISGKTLGTTANTSSLELNLWTSSGTTTATRSSSTGIQNFTASIWGVQLEYGSVATYFTTATGTLQGELAACQRYYTRLDGSAYTTFGAGRSNSATAGHVAVNLPVPMRTTPTAGFSTASGFIIWTGSGATTALTAIGLNQGSKTALLVDITTAASQTVGYGTILFANNSATTYIEASAEL